MQYGKSTFAITLSQYLEKRNAKTLLIDFDIFNCSIHTILGINKYPKLLEENTIENFIIKMSKKLHILCGIDLLLNDVNEMNYYKIYEILDILKNNYDFIIIDTSSEINCTYLKIILSICNKIIFLIEPNLSEIKKAKKILEVYIEDWNIVSNKIKIIFNKTNKYQIAEEILNELFSRFQIIGNIKYNEKYNLFINKNSNIEIEKEEKIYNKIFEK